MVICLDQGADLHMAQRISLPLTVSCFSRIQIGFTFLVPAHPGSPGQRAVKRVCVCVYARLQKFSQTVYHLLRINLHDGCKVVVGPMHVLHIVSGKGWFSELLTTFKHYILFPTIGFVISTT